jgi:hypothetical protein
MAQTTGKAMNERATLEELAAKWDQLIGPLQIDVAVNRLVLQVMISHLAGSGEHGAKVFDSLEEGTKAQAQTLIGDGTLSPAARKLLQERQQIAIETIERFFDAIRKQAGLSPKKRKPQPSH